MLQTHTASTAPRELADRRTRAADPSPREPRRIVRAHAIVLAFLVACLLATACASKPLPLAHNNPDHYRVAQDIHWASPDGFPLTMDIYTPRSGREPYPVLMIFHGGGWLVNNNTIMTQASEYIATNADYVVCNINYRLLGDQDNTVTIDQIVEDVFGAVLWVQENIGRYQGDPTRIAVTGDSAGGHLSAMIVNSGHKLASRGYTPETLAFNPSYLPPGKTAEQIAHDGGIQVQAAILSYGAFDLYQSSLDGYESWANPFWLLGGARPRGFLGPDIDVATHAELYKGVSPFYNIPTRDLRALPPQLLTVGSEDRLVTPESVQRYQKRLDQAGHPTAYWEYEGRNHAFLDSGSSLLLGSSFEEDAPVALDVMIKFLDDVFPHKQAATPLEALKFEG